MAVANLNLPAFPTFDLTKKDTLKTRWNKYLKRFNTLCKAIGVTDDGQKHSMLFTYIEDEMYEIYENIIPVEEPTFTQVNAAFEAQFAPTSNPAYECYLFHQLKQQQDETIHGFYIRLKEQGQEEQTELATCSNKLRRYSFQNPDKSLSELLTIAKSFDSMKVYVCKVEKPDEHPVNALRRTPRRSGKNGNLNRRGMINNNKTCFRCCGVYPHKVKCPAESKVCNKYKKVGHYAKCCKTKLTQESSDHKETIADKIHILNKH